MPFLAKEKIDIPTQDITSWALNSPSYEHDRLIYIDASDPSKSISTKQARTLIRQLVAGFKHAGLQEGDCVCIHSFSNIYYPILVFGIIAAGCIFTGTNPSYTPHELAHHLRASRTALVISEPSLIGRISMATASLGIRNSRILILNSGSDSKDENDLPGEFESWRSLLKHSERDWVAFDNIEKSRDTTAMLLFSSGTTGLPKPAMLSHYNLVAQHTLVYEYRPRPYSLSRLIALPMFHAATTPSLLSALRSNQPTYIMRRFSPLPYLTHCLAHKITDLTLVPPMVHSLLSLPLPVSQKRHYLSTIRSALAGAAPLDASTQARFQELLPDDAPFTQIWAMTETSCFASLFHYPENDATGSVGRFLPNIHVKIIDEEGKEVEGYGEENRGEMCVRGPTVFKGYLGSENGGRGREVEVFDTEGYFRTGDVMYCEEGSGLWYIVDRKKELIKVRGFQVAPAELEGVLLSHPSILDAAVIGIPVLSERSEGSKGIETEAPLAYIVKKPHTTLSEEDVKKYMEQRLAGYKRLEGGVRFVDAIPKTPSGKILKRILRKEVKAKGEGKGRARL